MLATSARRSATVIVTGLRVEFTLRTGIERLRGGLQALDPPMPCVQPLRASFTRRCHRCMSVATASQS